jgi:hypothetical protein
MTKKIKSVIIEDFIWKNPWHIAIFFLAVMPNPVQRHPRIPIVRVERCRRDTCRWSLHKEITIISNDSQMFSDVLRYFLMFSSVPKWSQMFPNDSNVLNFFDVFPGVPNIFQYFLHMIPSVSPLDVSHFLLATYGIWGKYWFRDEKNENFLLLIFTFQDFLWPKNMIWAIKNFPSVTRRCRCRCRCRWTQNLCHTYSLDHFT